MHKYIIDQLKDIDVIKITEPVILELNIYTVINHGSIQRRGGKIICKDVSKDYVPNWDEDNFSTIWVKCIKDCITDLKFWDDDNVYWCRGTNSRVIFVDNFEDRRIEFNLIPLGES